MKSTKTRVRAAARELAFRPNRTVKSLAHRDWKTIGVAVPTFTTPFHNELLKGVRTRLEGREAGLLIGDLAWEHPAASLRDFLAGGRSMGFS
jgi:LacI family transcriptional regulator